MAHHAPRQGIVFLSAEQFFSLGRCLVCISILPGRPSLRVGGLCPTQHRQEGQDENQEWEAHGHQTWSIRLHTLGRAQREEGKYNKLEIDGGHG